MVSGHITRFVGQAAKVESRALAGDRGDTRRIELQLVELPLMIERLAVEQGTDDLHHLGRAGVARAAGNCFAGHVG